MTLCVCVGGGCGVVWCVCVCGGGHMICFLTVGFASSSAECRLPQCKTGRILQ